MCCRDSGQVVRVLVFYCDDPSSNPAGVYIFYTVNWLNSTKIIEKEARNGPLKIAARKMFVENSDTQ